MNRTRRILVALFSGVICCYLVALAQVRTPAIEADVHPSVENSSAIHGSATLSASGVVVQKLAQANSSLAQNNQTAPLDFQGRMLVSISDADMVASAYVDRQLGLREGQDALSVIPLGGDYRQMQAIELAGVTNSVAGPPSAVAVSPDGRWGFVVESFKPADSTMQLFSDLERGTRLTAINLSNPGQPRIQSQIEIGTRPETVEVNPQGDMLLVTLHPADGRQLAFVPWNNGEFGVPIYATMPNIAKEVRVSHAVWHPSGNFIAATLVDQGQVLFAQVVRGENTVALEPWGNQVLVGKYPFKIMFAQNGQFLMTTNLQWGPDVRGFWTEAPRGSIGVVRFASQPSETGQPQHFLVSVAETGVSPEGIAISPDGRLVATTNLERSYLPYDDGRITWFSSLTLMEFDAQTGHLETLGDFLYEGILPEALVFDRSGKYLAVANYDHFDQSRPGGSIDFWRVVTDDVTHPTPRLVQTTHSVPVTRGVHSMVLVP